ncbi:MAG: hypothetical protein QW775_01960 [Ignisphaera sp.]|uniref:Uncharacterized protein n=1 Tax=Ignisphaera aggregans TaxID=334771 RepID=A0A7C4JLE2_9CREN
MIEQLKTLSEVVDVVATFGAPNVRYLLKSSIEEDSMILYRGSTNECKVLVPFNAKKIVEHIVPKNCVIVYYSYDTINSYGYVLGRNFRDIALSVIKSFTKQGEDIGIPLLYIDASLYSILVKYWRIKDITKDIRIIRSKKNDEDLNTLINIHNSVKQLLNYCMSEVHNLLNCLSSQLYPKRYGIYLETLSKLDNLITLRLLIKKDILIVSYRWSLPLSKEAEDIITRINNTIESKSRNFYSRKCADLIKNIRIQLHNQGIKVSVNICGIGTEECEYPTTYECIYEDAVLNDGMSLKIEVVVNENMYIPKIFVIKGKKIEVY